MLEIVDYVDELVNTSILQLCVKLYGKLSKVHFTFEFVYYEASF